MTRTLLLHIGMPKCGSTFLQRVLLKNQKSLADAGISYPGEKNGNHPGNGSGVFAAKAARLKDAFGEHQTLIWSHEDLFVMGPKAANLAQATRDLDVRVHVLAFIRPFNQFIFGDYSQHMKQNFNAFMVDRRPYGGRNFETFAVQRSAALRPAQRFSNWINGLTVEGGHTPQFTLASHRDIKSTVTPFLNNAQMDWTVPDHQSNQSLRMEDCDTLAAMIRDQSIEARVVANEFSAAMARAGQPDEGRTAERIRWIEAIFEKQNADLMEMFGFDNRMKND